MSKSTKQRCQERIVKEKIQVIRVVSDVLRDAVEMTLAEIQQKEKN